MASGFKGRYRIHSSFITYKESPWGETNNEFIPPEYFVMMYTVGQIAKRFSLSRGTLLYYDAIGLLKPSGRSEANYRLYSEKDIIRMKKISLYREAGLSLHSILNVLEKENDEVYSVLEKRLLTINKEIQFLRDQQKIIINLLKNEGNFSHSRVLTKERWISLLQATGLDETDMKKWHVEFERMAPEAHQDFLESLGIQAMEIQSIRRWSKENS